jgi:hypothetical protein
MLCIFLIELIQNCSVILTLPVYINPIRNMYKISTFNNSVFEKSIKKYLLTVDRKLSSM